MTGAGISADSGLPTYRGVGGLYEDAATESGLPIEKILSGPMLRRDPALCWRHIAQIEEACRGAQPNAAHRIIADLQTRCEVVVLTQNVDGLHRQAGSQTVIEIHGNVHGLKCTHCGHRWSVADYAALDLPPTCPQCGGLVRPEVVLFEEMLPDEPVQALMMALQEPFDLVFSIGTTSVFPYIAGPVLNQVEEGRPAVEINPGTTSISEFVPWRLRTGAAEAMSALWGRLGAARP